MYAKNILCLFRAEDIKRVEAFTAPTLLFIT